MGQWVKEENGQGEEYDVNDLNIIDAIQVGAMSLSRIEPEVKTKKNIDNRPETSGGAVTARCGLAYAHSKWNFQHV